MVFTKNITCFGILVCIVVTAGCVSPEKIVKRKSVIDSAKHKSAGHIGCLPSEIEVNYIDPKFNTAVVWTATCKSKVYVCSESNSVSGTMSCSLKTE